MKILDWKKSLDDVLYFRAILNADNILDPRSELFHRQTRLIASLAKEALMKYNENQTKAKNNS